MQNLNCGKVIVKWLAYCEKLQDKLKTLQKYNSRQRNKIMAKVLLGLSGGVDSSVAAYLLQQAGYEVVGLHFSLTDADQDLADLKAVCDHLSIKYYVEDFSKIFGEKVFAPFLEEYRQGNTPNICVNCNRHIKFGVVAEKAEELGCQYIATGHYCSVENVDGKFYLKKGVDGQKDQTYFLSNIKGEVLPKILFPLGGYTKDQVRQIALDNHIPTAKKKDSSDVCLAQGKKFGEFIKEHIEPNFGDIITVSGEVVGRHEGLYKYTLGQRKGLNLGGKSGEDGRWFVVKKDIQNNRLYVSHGDESLLFSKVFYVENPNFFNPMEDSFDCDVKARYRQIEKPCHVEIENSVAKVTLIEPERAVTVGQYAVFYKDNLCLGGGKIVKVEENIVL